MDSKGRLFVGDRSNNRIQIFDQDGTFIEEWKQFSRPSGIYIDKNDTIYVADSESGAVGNGRSRTGSAASASAASRTARSSRSSPIPVESRDQHERRRRRRGRRGGQHLRRGSRTEGAEEVRQEVGRQRRIASFGRLNAMYSPEYVRR